MDNCPLCGAYLKEIPTQGCVHCGKIFTPTRKWQTYCSPLCRSRYHYAARLKKEREGGVQVDGQE